MKLISIILYDQFLQFNNFQLGILLNKINLKNYDAILLTSDLVPGELLKFTNLKLLKVGVYIIYRFVILLFIYLFISI